MKNSGAEKNKLSNSNCVIFLKCMAVNLKERGLFLSRGLLTVFCVL